MHRLEAVTGGHDSLSVPPDLMMTSAEMHVRMCACAMSRANTSEENEQVDESRQPKTPYLSHDGSHQKNGFSSKPRVAVGQQRHRGLAQLAGDEE
jgi:hypothetical protein